MSHRENKAHALSERGNDLYETPAVAVRALMAIEWMPRRIWEPACGPGAIVREPLDIHAVGTAEAREARPLAEPQRLRQRHQRHLP